MFVPGRPFQARLIFVSKAGAFPSEALLRCSTLGLSPGLTHKHQTRLEKPPRDNTNLLLTFANYRRQSFINLCPREVFIKVLGIILLLSLLKRCFNYNRLTLTVIWCNSLDWLQIFDIMQNSVILIRRSKTDFQTFALPPLHSQW